MTHFLPRRLPRPRLHGRRAAGLSLLEMLLVIALIAAIGLITALAGAAFLLIAAATAAAIAYATSAGMAAQAAPRQMSLL